MKRFIAIGIGLVIIGCSTAPKGTSLPAEPAGPVVVPAIRAPEKAMETPGEPIERGYGELLRDLTVSAESFNPSQGQEVEIAFVLTGEAAATIEVFDPDNERVTLLAEDQALAPGAHRIRWNGRDSDNRVVPDEAYYFTVTVTDASGAEEIYDPTVFSGGVTHDITRADVDPQLQTINYTMPEPGRVMIRMGIQNGPLLNQLVDWQPRARGSITEYWDGRDADRLMDIHDLPGFKMIITYFSFPENSVIAFGNKAYTFREYKTAQTRSRVPKSKRARSVGNQSHHFQQKRTTDYCPSLTIDFANVRGGDANGLPVLYDKALVRIDLAAEDKPAFKDKQFEICFFLDQAFYAEDETGYTPFNWVWDLSGVAAGEHVLTVNVSSFSDQIGVISRKVKVVK